MLYSLSGNAFSFLLCFTLLANYSLARPTDENTSPPCTRKPSTTTAVWQATKTSTNLPSKHPTKPSQCPWPLFPPHPQPKPAKATIHSHHSVQVTTEQATDCNEFPDPGYGGSDAPNYKYWPTATALNVSCYLDVVVDRTKYTYLRTTDSKTGDVCWVDEMNIVEPQTAMALNGTIISAPPPSPAAATLKSTSTAGVGATTGNDTEGIDPDELEEPEDDSEDDDPRSKRKPGIGLSDVLPACTRPRPYQIWTTRNDYLLPKDGFHMLCYAKPDRKSKKYEVQWGARHVWCYKEGEEVGGKTKWWKDAHVLSDASKAASPKNRFTSVATFFMRAKKDEHCWIPADAFDSMVFGIPGAGRKCMENMLL